MRGLLRFAGRFGRWAMGFFYVVVLALVLLFMTVIDVSPATGFGIPSATAPGTADLLWSALRIAFATGVLAAALVEVFKRLTGVRGVFHLFELREYLREGVMRTDGGAEKSPGAATSPSGGSNGPPDDAVKEANFREAWTQLERGFGEVWLTREVKQSEHQRLKGYPRRDARYFFDLPLEQLMGQIGGAVETAVTKPASNRQLLECFAGQGAAAELGYIVSNAQTPEAPQVDAQYVRNQAIVSERVQRGLDALQVIVGHRWRWFIRAVAGAVCALLGVVAVEMTGTTGFTAIFIWAMCAVPGTFFSWLSRDLTAVVERFRR